MKKSITENRKFWKTFKLMLSGKTISNKKIVLVKNEKFLSNNDDVAETLNNFFSNVTILLGISQNDCEAFVEGIRSPNLKAILKYRCHLSILAVREKFLSNKYLSFYK